MTAAAEGANEALFRPAKGEYLYEDKGIAEPIRLRT
jgi:hypothetical protein